MYEPMTGWALRVYEIEWKIKHLPLVQKLYRKYFYQILAFKEKKRQFFRHKFFRVCRSTYISFSVKLGGNWWKPYFYNFKIKDTEYGECLWQAHFAIFQLAAHRWL